MSLPRITLDPGIDPWEMQPEETSESFAMFAYYRDKGPRRQVNDVVEAEIQREKSENPDAWDVDAAEYARKWEIKRVRVSERSGRYRWRERARAFDQWMDRLAVRERAEAHARSVSDMAARHATMARGMTGFAGRFLQKIVDDERFRETRISELSVGEFIALVSNGIRLERMVLGVGDGPSGPDVPASEVAPTQPPGGLTFEEAKRIAREAARASVADYAEPPPPSPPSDDPGDGAKA